jgi:hypothetical protein
MNAERISQGAGLFRMDFLLERQLTWASPSISSSG